MHPAMTRPSVETLSDSDLQRAWFDDRDDDGLAFNEVYRRYRDQVRAAMQAAGLDLRAAEVRVGSVFLRTRYDSAGIPMSVSLRDRLFAVAREVAGDPNWTPPL